MLTLLKRLILFMLISEAHGDPVVIYDSGNTRSMPVSVQLKHLNFQQTLPSFPQTFDPLPVHSQLLTPGIVHPRIIDRPSLDHPVFIVGYDKLSIKWIEHNREQLKQHRATGIAVNVENQAQLRELRQAASGLELSPVAGDKIAKQLELDHYPALISRKRIEQ